MNKKTEHSPPFPQHPVHYSSAIMITSTISSPCLQDSYNWPTLELVVKWSPQLLVNIKDCIVIQEHLEEPISICLLHHPNDFGALFNSVWRLLRDEINIWH